jgi:nucleotide-binding universal stress UspA family protein
MTDFKNILVAYDSSGFANRSFKKALDIAKKYSAKIYTVNFGCN